MSAEKFFENGGRPIDVEQANFLNDNAKQAEVDPPTTPLPAPASCATPKHKPKLSTAVIIPIWIALSSTVIIYNNYLYNTLNFKYPVFLVTYHLGFAVHNLSPLSCHSNTSFSHLPRFPGRWHAHFTADDSPPRRRKRCPSYEGHVCPLNTPHRPSLQWKSHPQQYCVSLSECSLHPNAQGMSLFSPLCFFFSFRLMFYTFPRHLRRLRSSSFPGRSAFKSPIGS